MNDYRAALQSEERALAIHIKPFEEDHESTADSYRALAVTQNRMHEYSAALQSHQRALAITLSTLNCLEKIMKALLTATGNSV